MWDFIDFGRKKGLSSRPRGKPAGGLIGFAPGDDWLDHRRENDSAFPERIERARMDLRAGQGIRLKDSED